MLDLDVSIRKEGRKSYRRYDYVNFRTVLDGQPFETPLDHTRDLIDTLKRGQTLEVVYLEGGKWQNPDGQRGFFDDHRPVPLAYVRQNSFTSSYAYLVYTFLAVTAGLFWLGRRRR